jgi:penicillin amidase
LRETLGAPGARFTPADFERLQNDEHSHFAKAVLPFLVQAFQDSIGTDPDVRLAFEYFRNWNFVFAQSDVATSIFQEFTVQLFRNIFADEMGDDVYHDFVILLNVPTRVTLRLLQEESSPWFDDVRTEAVETRDVIVRQSLRGALRALRERLGDDTKTWRWGDLHTVTLTHLFGLRRPWDKVFNIGPFPYGGGSTALVSGEYSYNEPFAVMIGASYRQIFDLGPSGASRAILSSGQSGQVFHDHYRDQTTLWLRGGYRSYRWNMTEDSPHKLLLEPGR